MATWHVGVGADDGYWYDLEWLPANSYILLLHNTVTPHTWFRFTNVTIPPGSIIDTAKLSVQAQQNSGAANGVTTIQGFDEVNCAAPTNIADYNGKAQTTASVPWTPGAWTLGTWYDTPDISTVIQEIINLGGWASGNALCLALDQTTIDSAIRKDCFSFETADNQDAILTVTYHGGGATLKKGSCVPAMTALLTKFSALKQPREPRFQPRTFPKFTPRTLI